MYNSNLPHGAKSSYELPVKNHGNITSCKIKKLKIYYINVLKNDKQALGKKSYYAFLSCI